MADQFPDTTKKVLSPAAQAVLDAAQAAYWKHDAECPADAEIIAAAALRAAADQVVPEPDDWDEDNLSTQGLRLLRVVRDKFLTITTELERHS